MPVVTRFSCALAISALLLNCVSADELTDIVNLHRTKLESIVDIEVDVISITFKGGKESSRNKYTWAYSGGEERLIIRANTGEFQGEFTGIRFTLGNRDFYNGSRGFFGLKEFDGTLDQQGELPADSLASVLINEGYPVGKGLSVDIWGQMGCYLIGLTPPSKPMWSVFEESLGSQFADDEPSTIFFKTRDAEFRAVVEPQKDYLISRYERKDKYGVCNFKVDEFQQIEEFGFFPAKFSCHVNGELFYRTEIAVASINKPLPQETLKVTIPPMTPFNEEHTGKFGVWGDGKPLRYFSSNEEARLWDQERKQKALALRKGPKHGNSLGWYVLAILASSGVLFYFAKHVRK